MRLWETLLAATERKGTRLGQASQQQQFNRGVEDLEIWLSEVEGQLLSEDYGKDLTSVQNLQKKHALLEADVSSHQDRIDAIKAAAQQFIDSAHFDVDSILAKQVSRPDISLRSLVYTAFFLILVGMYVWVLLGWFFRLKNLLFVSLLISLISWFALKIGRWCWNLFKMGFAACF